MLPRSHGFLQADGYSGCGSDEGGKRAANFYRLISTCHRHKLDPFRYLHDLFQRLPGHQESKLLNLTPVAWGKEQARGLATAA